MSDTVNNPLKDAAKDAVSEPSSDSGISRRRLLGTVGAAGATGLV
ncbi:twin-arginine translocation signal domain-containing protein, partial [Streptomyces lunaelactis]|nr:twin-arginine translocation signal domain-containing protein [Streptomyces lunaelactis]